MACMSAQTDLTYGEQEEADRHHFQRMRLSGQLDVLRGQVVLPWGVGVGRCIIIYPWGKTHFGASEI